MSDKNKEQIDSIMRYAQLIEKQTGKAVRPWRSDGYVNLLNRYGTSKDTTEHYQYKADPTVPDELLTQFYEGNGLFAKIIDTPAEEAIKHGFYLDGIKDDEVNDFYYEALDELDWEETAMTAIKWSRLFGGAIAVMLINDGRGIDEPLDWRNIQSIDDIRVFDRSVIQPDYASMYSYDPDDPFRTRGSRLGMPEYYYVFSKYGNFTVHESRCLVFQNGILPENCTNSVYQLWGMPEYVRIKRAIRDAELAHGSGPKMLDRSVQAIYKMKDLAAELATEEGEGKVLKRLHTIDMARGLLNSITIDSEGEDYDFRTFQFSGVSEIIDTTCNFLSALTSIPQTILFGRSPAGMNATGESDLENYYNYVARIQKRMVRSNLRYLLSVIFQAGLYTGEIEEVPKINIKFNPLWSLSEMEQADLDQKKAQTQQTKAQTAQVYVNMQAIDPSEVRKNLGKNEEFDVENMLDDIDDEDIFNEIEKEALSNANGNEIPDGNSPDAAPAATKLPQDMNDEDNINKALNGDINEDSDTEGVDIPEDENYGSVGVLVVSNGKILSGTRHNDFGYGLICGPGGHIEKGETPEQAAFRETKEEFGISPNELILLGEGPTEPETGLKPYLFLCTDYEGEPNCEDLEMSGAKFRTLEELDQLAASLFQPFADGLEVLKMCLETVLFYSDDPEDREKLNYILSGEVKADAMDGGPGSGNHGHEGVPGEIGGSAPSGKAATDRIKKSYKSKDYTERGKVFRKELEESPLGTKVSMNNKVYTKTGDDEYSYEWQPGKETKCNTNFMVNNMDKFNESKCPDFEMPTPQEVAISKVRNQEIEPEDTDVPLSKKYEGKRIESGMLEDLDDKMYSSKKEEFTKNAERELSDDEVYEMLDGFNEFKGTDYTNVVAASAGFGGPYAEYSRLMSESEKTQALKHAEAVEKMISVSDKYTGTAKRAMVFQDGEYGEFAHIADDIIRKAESGEVIDMGHTSSWTTSDSTVNQVLSARTSDDSATRTVEIVYSVKSKTGVDTRDLEPWQDEIIFSKNAQFVGKSVKKKTSKNGTETYEIELEEITEVPQKNSSTKPNKSAKSIDKSAKTTIIKSKASKVSQEERAKAIVKPIKPDGNTYIFPAGSKIKLGKNKLQQNKDITVKGVITIAKGSKIDKINSLISLGGRKDSWLKKGGTAEVEISGKTKKMQVHFFEEPSVGCTGTKIVVDETKEQRIKRKGLQKG